MRRTHVNRLGMVLLLAGCGMLWSQPLCAAPPAEEDLEALFSQTESSPPSTPPSSTQPAVRRAGDRPSTSTQREPARLFDADQARPLAIESGESGLYYHEPAWRTYHLDRRPAPPTLPPGDQDEPALTNDLFKTWNPPPAPIPSRRPRIADRYVVPAAANDAPAPSPYHEPTVQRAPVQRATGVPPDPIIEEIEEDVRQHPEPAELRSNETARVILELMETLGRSVLDGTVFQKPPEDEELLLPEVIESARISPREALIRYIRELEAEDRPYRTDHYVRAAEHRVAPEPPLAASPHSEAEELVDVLRRAGRDLDMLASSLEEQDLYYRADQLRQLASQLRHEARGIHAGWSMQAPPLAPEPQRLTRQPTPIHGSGVNSDAGVTGIYQRIAQPKRDLETELEELRNELRKTQELLELRARLPKR